MKKFLLWSKLALLAFPAWVFWWAASKQAAIHTALEADKPVEPARGREI